MVTRAFAGLAWLGVALAGSLFLPAGTIDYWQAWVFLCVFLGPALAITIYLVKNDPALLERRVIGGPSAETDRSQKVIQVLASVAFIVQIVLPAVDHRFAWSSVPPYAVAVGDALIVLGYLIVFLVFKANTFASATIEIRPEQRIIDTGPYALVRHPMYSGALVMLLGVPLALGSWWGLLVIVPMTLVIAWRLTGEEAFLTKNLPGYSQYLKKVRYRLVPFIW